MRHVKANIGLGRSYRERSLVHFDIDLFHLKVLIQNGIGGLVTGHRCGGLPFMEDVTHASPHANYRAPEVLWRGFVPQMFGTNAL